MKKTMCFIYSILLLLIVQEAEAGKRKVLLIGLDGLRSDVLRNLHTSSIEYLAKNGFGTYESWHQDITISGPSWSSILCGVYHDKHGVKDNSFQGKKYSSFPMIPVLAKQLKPDLKFGMYMEWKGLFNNSKNNSWDQMLLGEIGNTDKTTEEATNWISNSDLDFYFVYFGAVDYWGHLLGFSARNPFYVSAIKNADHSIAELMNALKNRSNYADEDWLILVTTDHGGNGLCHGGFSESERQIFWFAYSERIKHSLIKGQDAGNKNTSYNKICEIHKRNSPVQTDIAVTALHHLLYDTGYDPQDCTKWKLDGRSWLKEMGLSSDKKLGASLAVIQH